VDSLQSCHRRFPAQPRTELLSYISYRVQSAIHSVLTTRVILNIREAASRRLNDFSFDLHLSGSDAQPPRPQISFAENPTVFHPDVDCEGGVSQSRERFSSVGTVHTGMVSVSNSTAPSHITLPMTRDAKGKRVVGRPEPDVDDCDGMDSIHVSPNKWA